MLHYGQEIFEGMKAYRHADGSIWTFRPEANAARFSGRPRAWRCRSCRRRTSSSRCKQIVAVDRRLGAVRGRRGSLYLRPFMFATEAFLGVRPAREVSYCVIASPAGDYFGGGVKPVSIWLSERYARAGHGGTGEAKCGGNYAASLAAQIEAEQQRLQAGPVPGPTNDYAVDELGGMNVFFVLTDGTPGHPRAQRQHPARGHPLLRAAAGQGPRPGGPGAQVHHRRMARARRRRHMAEVFACGTAAVITPIGELKTTEDTLVTPAAQGEPVWKGIREQLLGIQTGTVEDTHGWLTRLA